MYCLEEALFLKELSHCLHVHYGSRQFSTSMPAFQIMCIYILCIPHTSAIMCTIMMVFLVLIPSSGWNYNVIFWIVFNISHYMDLVQGGCVITPLKDPSLSPSSETR